MLFYQHTAVSYKSVNFYSIKLENNVNEIDMETAEHCRPNSIEIH